MKPGARAQIVRVHPVRGLIENRNCVKAVIGRIVTVTEPCSVVGFPAWHYAPLISCPLSLTNCKFAAFLDDELLPLPDEEDCIDIHADVDIPIDVPGEPVRELDIQFEDQP